jgi:hypothetical protein
VIAGARNLTAPSASSALRREAPDLRIVDSGALALVNFVPCSRNIPMFLKHEAKNINEIEMVAPTGFGRQTCFPSFRSKA